MNKHISLYSVFRQHLSVANDKKWIYWESDGAFPRIQEYMRVNSVAIFLCKSGYIDIEINQRKYHITPELITVLLPEHIVRIIKISDDYSGCSLIIDHKEWTEIRREVSELPPYYSTVRDLPSISITLSQFNLMLDYCSILKEKFSLSSSYINSLIIKKITVILFYEIHQFYSYVEENMPVPSKEEKILQDFIKLVATNFKRERNVIFYATFFMLTPKYLSQIIKRVSQISASQWINNYVIAEASVLLHTTNLSIKEIAEELNFPDQSSFGRYFKHKKGVSPMKYKVF